MKNKTKLLVNIAMMTALAYVTVLVIRVPFASFLTYDPKDVVITISGFIFGPAVAVIISLLVSFVEMITVSTTGIIGFLMNAIASISFAFVAALVYRKDHTQKGAFIGLLLGTLTMSIMMLLWNYFLTPIYLNMPLEEVLPLLKSIIIPFNLVKGLINSAIVFIIYKPIVKNLRALKLIEVDKSANHEHHGYLTIAAIILLLVCVIIFMLMNGLL